VEQTLAQDNRRFRSLANYDMLYLGGGNARLIEKPLPDTVQTVSNEDGVTGGLKVWNKAMDASFIGESSAYETWR
jgi:polyphosphate glucokinase